MAASVVPVPLRTLFSLIDPRRSLVTGAVWLIIALAATFSIAAAVWVGSIARQNVLEQHVRRLSLETDQLSSDVGQALAARLAAIHAATRILRENGIDGQPNGLGEFFDELLAAYPQLDWIAIADANGTVVKAVAAPREGSLVTSSRWFASALQGPWLGVIDEADTASRTSSMTSASLGDLAAPIRDEAGHVVGVVAGHLSWRRSANHPQRLTDEADKEISTQSFVLDRAGLVLIGPKEFRDKVWSGIPTIPSGGMPSTVEAVGTTSGATAIRASAGRTTGARIAFRR